MIKCVTLLLHSLKHLPPAKHQHKNTFKIYLIYINLKHTVFDHFMGLALKELTIFF